MHSEQDQPLLIPPDPNPRVDGPGGADALKIDSDQERKKIIERTGAHEGASLALA